MQLKRWETGRKPESRNIKGKGGSARAKQLQERLKNLAKKLVG
jgi:hypothetical protein